MWCSDATVVVAEQKHSKQNCCCHCHWRHQQQIGSTSDKFSAHFPLLTMSADGVVVVTAGGQGQVGQVVMVMRLNKSLDLDDLASVKYKTEFIKKI